MSAVVEMIAAAGATIVAVAALVVSVKSLNVQKESARASTISAEAAQRANVLTEQRLQREFELDGDHRSEAEEQPEGFAGSDHVQGAPAPGSPPIAGGVPAAVRADYGPWTLDRRGKKSFVLRNVGSTTAEEVRIPSEALPPIARNLPESATLRPNESVEFVMTGAWGHPVPNEIPVIWKGNPGGILVPVPGHWV